MRIPTNLCIRGLGELLPVSIVRGAQRIYRPSCGTKSSHLFGPSLRFALPGAEVALDLFDHYTIMFATVQRRRSWSPGESRG